MTQVESCLEGTLGLPPQQGRGGWYRSHCLLVLRNALPPSGFYRLLKGNRCQEPLFIASDR